MFAYEHPNMQHIKSVDFGEIVVVVNVAVHVVGMFKACSLKYVCGKLRLKFNVTKFNIGILDNRNYILLL